MLGGEALASALQQAEAAIAAGELNAASVSLAEVGHRLHACLGPGHGHRQALK